MSKHVTFILQTSRAAEYEQAECAVLCAVPNAVERFEECASVLTRGRVTAVTVYASVFTSRRSWTSDEFLVATAV